MSHREQIAFVASVVRANAALVRGARVLEIGSYDVNGSLRQLFGEAGSYLGVDLVDGPGVDVLEYGHMIDDPDGSYDITVSGECFEHDEHWRQTFANMHRLTRPGGLVVVTCASRGRPEHGTRRTDVRESPGTQSLGLDHYRNVTELDLRALPEFSRGFDDHLLTYNPVTFDLYFAGVRSGGAGDRARGVLPSPADVQALQRLMPWPHRLVRAPLRLFLKLLPERLYQELAWRYWRALLVVARLGSGALARASRARPREASTGDSTR